MKSLRSKTLVCENKKSLSKRFQPIVYGYEDHLGCHLTLVHFVTFHTHGRKIGRVTHQNSHMQRKLSRY